MSVQTCRFCGRPIMWARTLSGAAMPVDAASSPRGDVQLDGDRARVVPAREAVVLARMPGVVLHTRHACAGSAAARSSSMGRGRPGVPNVLTEPSSPAPVRPPAPRAPARLIDVWCDGSCPVPMGPGGWAAIVRYLDLDQRVVLAEREIAGFELETTNQRMELQAAAEALYLVTKRARFQITSDSQYLVQGMTERWYQRWQRNGWRNAKGKPVVNRELWEALVLAAEFHDVTWRRVKGHAKGAHPLNERAHPLNERADELAGEQTTTAQEVAVYESIRDTVEDLELGLDRAVASEAA